MGIFQNKINGTGTFLKTNLEAILKDAKGEGIGEKLNSVKDRLSVGIQSTQDYKFLVKYEESPFSLEAIFDFQQKSGGYDTRGLQKAATVLRKSWAQKDPKKFRFTHSNYELWLQGDKVHVKISSKQKLSSDTFGPYLANYEKIFNFLIGGEPTKTANPSNQNMLKQTPPAKPIDEVYDTISQNLQTEGLEPGKRLVIPCHNQEIDVFQGGIDEIQLHAQIKINASPDQIKTYKDKPLEPRFDNIGANYATCIEDTSHANAPQIYALVKRTIAAYEKLIQRFPGIDKS
jgi:hypothetical protein